MCNTRTNMGKTQSKKALIEKEERTERKKYFRGHLETTC